MTRASRKSSVHRRGLKIAGRRSSISIEDQFWNCLKNIAKARHETVTNLVTSINAKGKHANLSSAIRLYVLDYYKAKSVCMTSSGGETYLTLMRICHDFAEEPQNRVIRDKLIELSRIWTEAALPSPDVAKIGDRTRH